MSKTSKIPVDLSKTRREKRIIKSVISSFRIEDIEISKKEADEVLEKVKTKIRKPVL